MKTLIAVVVLVGAGVVASAVRGQGPGAVTDPNTPPAAKTAADQVDPAERAQPTEAEAREDAIEASEALQRPPAAPASAAPMPPVPSPETGPGDVQNVGPTASGGEMIPPTGPMPGSADLMPPPFGVRPTGPGRFPGGAIPVAPVAPAGGHGAAAGSDDELLREIRAFREEMRTNREETRTAAWTTYWAAQRAEDAAERAERAAWMSSFATASPQAAVRPENWEELRFGGRDRFGDVSSPDGGSYNYSYSGPDGSYDSDGSYGGFEDRRFSDSGRSIDGFSYRGGDFRSAADAIVNRSEGHLLEAAQELAYARSAATVGERNLQGGNRSILTVDRARSVLGSGFRSGFEGGFDNCCGSDFGGSSGRSGGRSSFDRAAEESLLTEPEFLRNAIAMYRDQSAIPFLPRVVGDNAQDVPRDRFADCVAIGRDGSFFCTGTLISPRLVVTAAHCAPNRPNEIFVGSDFRYTYSGRRYPVDRIYTVRSDQRSRYGDICVLRLAQPVEDVRPRAIATAADLRNARYVTVAGFGNSYLTNGGAQGGGAGRKRMVSIALAPRACTSGVGCNSQIEFVAMAVESSGDDTCNGDSGGPAYIRVGNEDYLVGCTSRGTVSYPICGRGGIYGNLTSERIQYILTVDAPRALGVEPPGRSFPFPGSRFSR